MESLPRLLHQNTALGAGAAAGAGYSAKALRYSNSQEATYGDVRMPPTSDSEDHGIPFSRMYSSTWDTMDPAGADALGGALGGAVAGGVAAGSTQNLDRNGSMRTHQSLADAVPLAPPPTGDNQAFVKVFCSKLSSPRS